MKYKTFMFITGVCLLSTTLKAQVFPLSDNDWGNPEFVERFLGSYGVLTEKEPQVTSTESRIFESVGEFLNANDSKGAIAKVRSVLNADSSAAIDFTLGNLLLQQNDFKAAIEAYQGAIKKYPNFLRAYKNAGLAFLQIQDYENSSVYLVKAIELGNQEGDTFGLLGYCYLNMGLDESALDAYRFAGVLAPKNKDWQVGRATALQRVGLYHDAIAKFDELIAVDSGNNSYYMAAANACLSSEQEMKATRYLELLRRARRADASVLMLLGDIYLNQNLYGLAKDVYVEVLPQAKSTDAERIFRFAKGLVAFGAGEDAVAFLGEIKASSFKLNSTQNQELLNFESQIALSMGDNEKAVDSLQKVIEGNPLNGEALLLLGGFYFDNGEYEDAVFYFERAQKIEEFEVDALIQTARVRVAQRMFEKAVNLLEKAQAIKQQSHIGDYLKSVRNALKASF